MEADYLSKKSLQMQEEKITYNHWKDDHGETTLFLMLYYNIKEVLSSYVSYIYNSNRDKGLFFV
jgi:hypothetical protein